MTTAEWWVRLLQCCRPASSAATPRQEAAAFDDRLGNKSFRHAGSDASSVATAGDSQNSQGPSPSDFLVNALHLSGGSGGSGSGASFPMPRPSLDSFRLYEPGRALSCISEEGSLTDRTERSVSSSQVGRRRATLETPPDPPSVILGSVPPSWRTGGGDGGGGISHSNSAGSIGSSVGSSNSVGYIGDTAQSLRIRALDARTAPKGWTPPTPPASFTPAAQPYSGSGGDGSGGDQPSAPTTVWKRGIPGAAPSSPALSSSTSASTTGDDGSVYHHHTRNPLVRQATGYVGQRMEGGGVVVTVVPNPHGEEDPSQSLWGQIVTRFGRQTSTSLPPPPPPASPGEGGRGARGQVGSGGSRGGGGLIPLSLDGEPSGGSASSPSSSSSTRAPPSLLASRSPSSSEGGSGGGSGLLLRNPVHGKSPAGAAGGRTGGGGGFNR